MAFHRCPECGNSTHYHCKARNIIAGGIRQSVADRDNELGYHEPAVDTRELRWVYDNAEGIANYIMDGLRANGVRLT